MRPPFVAPLLAAAVAAANLPAGPALARPAGIEAVRPWSRPAAAGANGAAFLTLVNHGPADALVSVDSAVAAKAELHDSSMAGGMTSMRRETRVPLPAGGSVSFAPGGRHIMLVGLKRALHLGDRVPATLHFASGKALKVDFAVSIAPPPAAERG
jgi:copper(I)-binding protein